MDANGLPVRIGLTPGEAHDNRLCSVLLSGLRPHAILLADRGYDADWIRDLISEKGAWANIPPKQNRKEPICFSPYLYRARNLVERFFNKIKQCRRVATRYDKLAAIKMRDSLDTMAQDEARIGRWNTIAATLNAISGALILVALAIENFVEK